MEQQLHSKALSELCRICGRHLQPAKKKRSIYLCAENATTLRDIFGVSVSTDDALIHPKHFCQTCNTTIYNIRDGRSNGLQLEVCKWEPHKENGCSTCLRAKQAQKGGRPAKHKGRPPAVSRRSATAHIHSIAPPSYTHTVQDHSPTYSTPPQYGVTLADLTCHQCQNVLDQPIKLTSCGSFVCAKCLIKWLSQCDDTLPCPCCSGHLRDFSTMEAAPLIQKLLGGLLVTCACGKKVMKESYATHRENGCHTEPEELHAVSVKDILVLPPNTPLTAIERELQTSLAKRSLATSPDDSLLRMKTGGQVQDCMDSLLVAWHMCSCGLDLYSQLSMYIHVRAHVQDLFSTANDIPEDAIPSDSFK